MTQTFAFQEPVCELGQGVFPGPNMMPSWKHPNATFNLLPNDHAGHKRRRSFSAMPPVAQDLHMYDADDLQEPNRRLSNDSLEQCPPVPNFCVGLDAAASQLGFQNVDHRGDISFYSRALDNSCNSLRRPPRIESTHCNGAGTYFMNRISSTTSSCMNDFQAFDHANRQSGQTFNHCPRPMDVKSAAAVAAQALANFQAGISTPDRGFLNQRNGLKVANGYTPGGNLSSSGSFFAYPSTGAPITKSTGNVVHNLAGVCNQNVIHDSTFGLENAHLNGNIHLRAGDSGHFNWQNFNSHTAFLSNGINGATNVLNSTLEVADHRLVRPQSPSTPRVDVGLTESQQGYLQEMHRLKEIADEPDSPRQNSRGRRLQYSAPLEQPSRNPFQDFEALYMYHKSDHPVEMTTTNAATACVTASETTGRTQQGETLCQPSGPPPTVAPGDDTGDKESSNHRFDLNVVPGYIDATPKPRKKFHPRVAKDKRTYKRRMDAKKNSGAPVVDGINVDLQAKNSARRANQTSQHDSNHGDGRESSFAEVMDIEVEDIGVVPKSKPVSVQHDTAVCDCEACIKLRLERRAVGQNTRLNDIEDCAMGRRYSENVFNNAQSPISPPERQGRGSWESREKRIDTPDGHDVGGSHESPDSDPRSSPSVRRNLFAASQAQAPASGAEGTWPDQRIGSSTRDLKGCFDANQSSALASSPEEAVRAVIHHPAGTRTPVSSSLKQFNQSGTHLDIYDYGQTNPYHLQDMVAQHRDSMLAMDQRNLIYQELHSNMALRNHARESGTIVPAYNSGRVEWNPWFGSFNSIRPAVPNTTSSSFMSRLCPRGILSPRNVTFRTMNQIQRVVYLKFILRSNNQLEMSPKMLLHHVLEHLPESEKEEFKSLWDVILTPVADEQMRQLAEHAKMEIAMPTSGQNHASEKHHRKPEKAKKPSKRQLQMQQSKAMTLWPDLMHDQTLSNSKALKEKTRSKATSSDSQEQQNSSENEELEMVPYENKSVVPYEGPFQPLRKRKPRPKVVLDNDTVREWKLLMGKPNGTAESVDKDSEKDLKWEEERRKMKAQAQVFIERMHVVQGDRSFSCWKGSVVDSVVGAFLTQNVNDVLSSSAFISMRSRFPGRGFRRNDHSQTSTTAAAAPEDTVAQSFDSELAKNLPLEPSASATSITMTHQDPQIIEPQSSASLQDGSFSITPSSPTRDVGHSYECPPNLLESQESHNVESNGAQSTQEVFNSPTPQITYSEHSHTASAKISSNSTVETTELESGLQSPPQELAPSNSSELSSDGAHNAPSKDPSELLDMNPDATTEGSELVDATNPSHGKYNPKTGLTGLERAKIEERQVSARKSFDFSHLEEEFRPRQRPTGLPRTEQTEDGVDWEAVRRADVAEVADVIKERGLNWILAGRIKAFLERLHLDYGALDLEWLRSMSTDQTKEFLLSIRGLGLKSVECIRLLTLHHLAFPVDTNVGRICVRLGWVPLEPLPEELQLHLLELYPVQATIQKYLWPRLCKLDHQTLYELHYQMISFGKVFCTKSKPNCNACPMRPECKHFASAVSSAKLALPAPERPHDRPTLALPPGTISSSGEDYLRPPRTVSQYCQPFVEEPMTPESEANVEDLDDIEDYPFSVEEVEEDAVMNLCIQESRKESCCSKGQACQNPSTKEEKSTDPSCCSPLTVMSESKPVQKITLEERESLSANSNVHQQLGNETCPNSGQDTSLKPVIEVVEKETNLDQESPSTVTEQSMSGDANPNGSSGSQEMVLVPLEAASIPVPKLKNVGRLRTVHYVYELPDNHPLLDGLDSREPDDPCTYLLAIWSPGEVPESIPNINDNANEENPFASSGSEGDESIKATLLVPCRTAMQGSFPLNGTYFQVNEVFADHASSLQPILVPRTLLWNLRRRFVFFGTSVTSIFRGMTAEEIQACFWRGYVCVRGFDRTTRAPKPLVGRLHLQAGKSSGKGTNMEA